MQSLAEITSWRPPGTAWHAQREHNGETVTAKLAAFEKLFLTHHDRVFRAAWRVTGSIHDAEDAAQTVFLRVLRGEQSFETVEEAGKYLYRAGVNAALDLMRSRRTAAMPLQEGMDARPSWQPDREHHPPELRELLRNAVAELHPTAAEMFALRYFEGYENSEIASLLDTTEGTVAVTLHRTRARLQKELGGLK